MLFSYTYGYTKLVEDIVQSTAVYVWEYLNRMKLSLAKINKQRNSRRKYVYICVYTYDCCNRSIHL